MSDLATRPERPTAANPETRKKFRRESFWQVIFPVAFTFLLTVGMVAALLLISGSEGTSIVADYSLILVIVPVLVTGLIILILLGAIGYLIGKLVGFIPPYTYMAHEAMHRVYLIVDQGTNKIASAVITAKSVTSGVNLFLQAQGILPKQDGKNGTSATPSQAEK